MVEKYKKVSEKLEQRKLTKSLLQNQSQLTGAIELESPTSKKYKKTKLAITQPDQKKNRRSPQKRESQFLDLTDSDDYEQALDVTAQKEKLEKSLKGVPLGQKKRILQQFEEDQKATTKKREEDAIFMVKQAYREKRISAFAAQDLIRLFEVMDEVKTAPKLQI